MSVKKGEVYWFNLERFTYLKPFETKVLLKDRPYLVVSRDDWNEVSGLCQIVPIQSNERFENLAHVINEDNKCIVTENITTVDQKLLGHYKETLSEEMIRKVDKALMYQLNMQYLLEEVKIETIQDLLKDNDVSSYLNTNILSDISNKIEAIIKQKFLEQKKAFMKDNVENVAIQLASNIEDLFSISDNKTEDKIYNKVEVKTETEDKVVNKSENSVSIKEKEKRDKYSLSNEEEEIEEILTSIKAENKKKDKKINPLNIPRKENGHIIWNEKTLKELVENSEKYSTKELCILYGFKTMHTCYQQVYTAKKKIKSFKK